MVAALNGLWAITVRFEFTNVAAAVAVAADKDRKLHAQFEFEDDGSTNEKEALIGASRSIWLGLWSEVRTLSLDFAELRANQANAISGLHNRPCPA
jgi:hypothetical protein